MFVLVSFSTGCCSTKRWYLRISDWFGTGVPPVKHWTEAKLFVAVRNWDARCANLNMMSSVSIILINKLLIELI